MNPKCKICEKEFFKMNSLQKTCGKVACAKLLEKNRRKEKAKKLSIRITGVDEDGMRQELRMNIETIMPKFMEKKQIVIKVKPGAIKTDFKKLSDKADKLWSQAVRTFGKCEFCGSQDFLNAHHIYGRANKAVRWNIKNGVCLCANHHQFSSQFSAHGTPAKFREWIKKHRDMPSLYLSSIESVKVTNDFLNERIKFLENYIQKNTLQ